MCGGHLQYANKHEAFTAEESSESEVKSAGRNVAAQCAFTSVTWGKGGHADELCFEKSLPFVCLCYHAGAD